ncbi:MAG: MFS transporter [Actinobacteria bacterium]|nr:MFS transporter [Actinomycetota bacterium]
MNQDPTRLPSNYWRQFVASGVSNIGDGMVHAAAPLLTLSLTSDERLIAGVSFSSMIPWLVLSLPAGVYIDRFDRRKLMVVANIIRAILFGIIAISAAVGSLSIWTFMVILIGVGCCEVIFDMSAQAFLPQIVPEPLLEKANGRLSSLELITNTFIGLPLGAWAFVVAVGVPFGVDAASFALAAVLVASIRLPKKDAPDASTNFQQPTFLTDLKEGLAWLWNNRLIRTLAIMLGITNMTAMFGDAIFVKYAAEELGVTGRAYGFLLALTAIGSILGGLLGDRIAKKLGVAQSIIYSYFVFGFVGIIYFFFPYVWAIAIAASLMGLAGTTWNVVTVSLRQRVIPSELFGRVNSVYRFIGTGSIGIGALIGGQIAYATNLRMPFIVAATICLSALAIGGPTLFREVRNHIAPEATPAPPSIT